MSYRKSNKIIIIEHDYLKIHLKMHCIVAKIYFKKKKVKFKTVKCYCHTTSDYIRQMK